MQTTLAGNQRSGELPPRPPPPPAPWSQGIFTYVIEHAGVELSFSHCELGESRTVYDIAVKFLATLRAGAQMGSKVVLQYTDSKQGPTPSSLPTQPFSPCPIWNPPLRRASPCWVWLCGVVVNALALLSVREVQDSHPGPATIQLGSNLGQVVYSQSHCLPSLLGSKKLTAYRRGYSDWTDLTA